MTFADLASLAVAYSDLIEVQDVINAMNANLPRNGPLGTTLPCDRPLDPRPRLKSTPSEEFNARQVQSPQPTIQPAVTITRGVDRYEPSAAAKPVEQETVFEPYKRSKSPVQPIWATLPPVTHISTVRVVKVVHQKVDLLARGSTLDMFV